MDQITINSIKLEQAEFVNRLMIDAPLSQNDIKIGLCLMHEILLKMKELDTDNSIEVMTD